GDLGLAFEEVSYRVRDDAGRTIEIAGWWIPRPQQGGGRCAVLLHGYADAKVGAIAWAPLWHAVGFHVLAVDLRAHGQSGGAFSTGGFFERDDIAQVLGQLRAARPGHSRQLVLFGVSLGAAVAAAAAAVAAAGAAEGDVDAVV